MADSSVPANPSGAPAGILILISPLAGIDRGPELLMAAGQQVRVILDAQDAADFLLGSEIRVWRRARVQADEDWQVLAAALPARHPGLPAVVTLNTPEIQRALREAGLPVVPVRRQARNKTSCDLAHELPLDAPAQSFRAAREAFEQKFIVQALLANRGNISHAARAIGMARRNLQVKIRKLGIQRFTTDEVMG